MTMKIPIYQADAFASGVFRGNPAAICPLDQWLPDELLQNIAAENNLSETAFIVQEPEGYRIRWFTPSTEVDLCGHATLATAHVFYEHLGFDQPDLKLGTNLVQVSSSDPNTDLVSATVGVVAYKQLEVKTKTQEKPNAAKKEN